MKDVCDPFLSEDERKTLVQQEYSKYNFLDVTREAKAMGIPSYYLWECTFQIFGEDTRKLPDSVNRSDPIQWRKEDIATNSCAVAADFSKRFIVKREEDLPEDALEKICEGISSIGLCSEKGPYTETGLGELCSSSHRHYMFDCSCVEAPSDRCDACKMELHSPHSILRIPLDSGAWEGSYCSEDCILTVDCDSPETVDMMLSFILSEDKVGE